MKNTCMCLSLLVFAFPAWAQNKLLPVVRGAGNTALEKAFVQTAFERNLIKTYGSAWGKNGVSFREIQSVPVKGSQTSMAKFPNVFIKKRVEANIQKLREALGSPVEKSSNQVLERWQARIGNPKESPLLNDWFAPMASATETSLHNNQMTAFFVNRLADKFDWLKARPQQSQNDLFTLVSSDAIDYLTRVVSRENMVVLGELHHSPAVQFSVVRLLKKLQYENPGRRIVLFTEFMNRDILAAKEPASLARYYRRGADGALEPATIKSWLKGSSEDPYAGDAFMEMFKANLEIYPLEDPQQIELFETQAEPGEFVSLYTVMERNKNWARVMDVKINEIRQTDPDALFVVYAGVAHTSWLTPFSVAKLFAKENPVVVELSANKPTPYNALYEVWGKNHPFFVPTGINTFYSWRGDDARELGRNAGFDYAFVVPE